ncbi:mitochondrial import receptor subunit tom5, partial [Musa troglodytarum]
RFLAQWCCGRKKTSTAAKSEPKTLNLERAIWMAKSSASMENLKGFLRSQVNDEEKWALNSKLLRAAGLFAASIVLMRNFGDLMAI